MPASRTARRAGQFLTGVGALIALIGLLVGAPLALLTFAGNPLPDHLPGLGEVGTTLTSRDDGQLFLRTLAIVGWAGWATFALSVLVELPARVLRRPAIRLPGLARQQRWAAALVGSVALILAVSPVAAAATDVGPARPTATQPGPGAPAGAPTIASGPAPPWLAGTPAGPADEPVPVYRIEKGDYLGHIADRYLGEFDDYRQLARLNKIRDPDRIRPGQMLHMPPDAADRGMRPHATGIVAVPPPPGGWPEEGPPDGGPMPSDGGPMPSDGGPENEHVAPQPPAVPVPAPAPITEGDSGSTYVIGASRAAQVNELNRPIAVAAVIAAASIVGAQIGAVLGLGLRRRPTGQSTLDGRHRRLGD